MFVCGCEAERQSRPEATKLRYLMSCHDVLSFGKQGDVIFTTSCTHLLSLFFLLLLSLLNSCKNVFERIIDAALLLLCVTLGSEDFCSVLQTVASGNNLSLLFYSLHYVSRMTLNPSFWTTAATSLFTRRCLFPGLALQQLELQPPGSGEMMMMM